MKKKRIFTAVLGTAFAVSVFAPIASVSANPSEISEIQQLPQELHYGWLKDIFRDHDDRPASPPRHEARRPAPPPPRHEARRPAPPPSHHGPYDDRGPGASRR